MAGGACSTALALTSRAPPLAELTADVESLDCEQLARVGLKLSAAVARGTTDERETRRAGRVINKVLMKLNRILTTERSAAASALLRQRRQSARDRLCEMAVCTSGFARLKESAFQSVNARATALQRVEFEAGLVTMCSAGNDVDDIMAQAGAQRSA